MAAFLRDRIIAMKVRCYESWPIGFDRVFDHEFAWRLKVEPSEEVNDAHTWFICGGKVGNERNAAVTQFYISNADLVQGFVGHAGKGIVPLAFASLAFAADDDRIVMLGHWDTGITRITGKIFASGPYYEAAGVWMGVAAGETPVRK